ncbi:MAG: nicotinate-nucleotide--dimethylbenzimidazole phosphoribosyltransferase [Dehalococcoidia bacterium]
MMSLPPIAIPPLDATVMAAVQRRLDSLTKPPGSLGRLEALAVQLAGISAETSRTFRRRRIAVFAADHGVADEGVSAYPQSVTAQMVSNFLAGGAAINVLARQVQADVMVVDMGVAARLPDIPSLVRCPLGQGTANIALGPAMSRGQAISALQIGRTLAHDAADDGIELVAAGDMGIANTTASAAIIAALTGVSVRQATGRGTGIDDAVYERKVTVIERALARNGPDPADAIDVLSKVGGFEIGAIAGFVLGAAERRLPAVIDGFISGAGALLATRLCPSVRDSLIAAHRSVEAGHAAVLQSLGLEPLFDLHLRLGEGTGAALAFHLVDAAIAIRDEMATFAEAGVSEAV